MRIAQIIDSLEIGGAERMAVNYANAIYSKIQYAALVTTRHDGPLKSDISKGVITLSLQRKSTMDLGAIFRLRKFCTINKITHVHAHGTSYFIAAMLKFVRPGIKVIWHDHYGLSEFLEQRKFRLLKLFSRWFCAIISVNEQLRFWASAELRCKHVVFLPNFSKSATLDQKSHDALQGKSGSRILCLANLREQKNHFLLLNVAEIIRGKYPEWTFHLVGKDFNDDYSHKLRQAVKSRHLSETVFLYGSRPDSAALISDAEICILTSKSEGLPVALIEYGMHGKSVVATSVGDVPEIISDGFTGFLSESNNEAQFAEKVIRLISSAELRSELGANLKKHIENGYSEEAVIADYFKFIQQACP